jgi:hypothetical protein
MTFLDKDLAEMMKIAAQTAAADRRRDDGLRLPSSDTAQASVAHFEQAAHFARSAWGHAE